MPVYEYKVIPAPKRGEKARGAKTTAERFAQALSHVMNDLGRDGWEYLRADTLPCEERVGLTGKATAFQNMLVFRRTAGTGGEEIAARPAEPAALPAISTLAPEGSAPRLVTNAAEPAVMPTLGPARNGGLAAE